MRSLVAGLSGSVLGGVFGCASSDGGDTAAAGMTSQPGDDSGMAESGSDASGNGVGDGSADDGGGNASGDGSADDSPTPEGDTAADGTQEGAPDPAGLAGGSGDGPSGGGDARPRDEGEDPGSTGGGADEPAPPVATICPPGPFAASPLTDASTPRPVCTGMQFTEGPVWFAERNTLYFSDMIFGGPGNTGQIFSYTPGGQCEEFIAPAGTNGLAIAPDGNLLGCRHGDQTVTIFDLETKEPSVFISDFEGTPLNSPNDVAIRSDGNMYFTDPAYSLGGQPQQLPGRAYRRDIDGVLSVIDEGAAPNGISLSPDENRLYVSHLGGGQSNVIVFDLDESGAIGTPSTFANVSSDGMAIDCAGNLYVTQGGVQIVDPGGEPIGTINTPGAANLAFGGPERRTLYVTATSTLYEVEMAIPGLPY